MDLHALSYRQNERLTTLPAIIRTLAGEVRAGRRYYGGKPPLGEEIKRIFQHYPQHTRQLILKLFLGEDMETRPGLIAVAVELLKEQGFSPEEIIALLKEPVPDARLKLKDYAEYLGSLLREATADILNLIHRRGILNPAAADIFDDLLFLGRVYGSATVELSDSFQRGSVLGEATSRIVNPYYRGKIFGGITYWIHSNPDYFGVVLGMATADISNPFFLKRVLRAALADVCASTREKALKRASNDDIRNPAISQKMYQEISRTLFSNLAL